MARRKRASKIGQAGQKRATGIKSFAPTLDLGNGTTMTAFDAAIKTLDDSVDDYNSTLSSLDGKLNTIVANERIVQDLSERMLSGVGSRYGKDSDEYEMAGGTRKSERRKPTKPKIPPTP
jgi:hypothetical protein